MLIHATFITFASDPEVLELVHAWDEYSLDNNPTGYEDTKAEALATYGDDVGAKVTVDIAVNEEAIWKALRPHLRISGEVQA